MPAVLDLIKLLKIGPDTMAIKRKTYRFRKGDIIDVEEFHGGEYGALESRGKRGPNLPQSR